MKKVVVFLVGLLAGALLLIVAADFTGTLLAKGQVRGKSALMLSRAGKSPVRVVSREDLRGLPPVVRKYMEVSGVLGKPFIRSVRIRQRGEMSLGPGKPWVPFSAEQYFAADTPEFIWFGAIRVAPLVSVSARDSYTSGEGRMFVRLMSLMKIDDARGKDMDMAALMRYLSECMWFPTSLLGKNIHWQAVGTDSARVFLADRGMTVSGLCRFNKRGDLIEFIAPRLCSITGKSEEWHAGPGDGKGGEAKYTLVNGITVPANGFASFKLASGMYPYIRLELSSLEFDPEGTF